jgi:tyrosinase
MMCGSFFASSSPKLPSLSSSLLVVSVRLLLLVVLIGRQYETVSAQNNCGVNRRRPWRSLTCAEQQAYLSAVQELKDNGVYDEITNVHQDSGDDNHFQRTFLPFHRWVIAVFERELQRVGGCSVTVPYWDWENGSRSRVLEWVLQPWSFGTMRRGCVPNGIAEDWRAENNNGCLIREFVSSVGFTRDVEVLSRIINLDNFEEFAENLEGAPHLGPHNYIGGPMEDFWAPDDPLFHLHHSNVDRIYSLWQDYWDHDRTDPDDMGWEHYDGDLDRPLRIRQRNRVDFDAPGRGRPPTPRELMHNGGSGASILNVQYMNDNLARDLLETDPTFINNENWHRPGNAPTRGCTEDNLNDNDTDNDNDNGGGGGGDGGGSSGNQLREPGNGKSTHKAADSSPRVS